MKPTFALKAVLLLISMFVAGALVLGASEQKAKTPKFSAADLKIIDAYYTKQLGDIAPGSLDRKGFPSEVEQALKAGEKLPEQLERQLQMLPKELTSKLSMPPGGYQLYKLGYHIMILRRSDLLISDVVKLPPMN